MKRTPLAHIHESLGARMVDFSGWYLPVQYTGIVAEHNATRNACTIFDTCHMGRLMLKGETAGEFLSSIATPDAAAMPDGRCRYGFLLTEDAGILDDLIVYRIAANEFMVVINSATTEKDIAQIRKYLPDDVVLQDISSSMAKVDIQGPNSTDVASEALGTDLGDLKYFRMKPVSFSGQAAIVSQTGYTGELGYEVYVPSELVGELWKKTTGAGASPAGLGARDTLRLEAGLPLYGHELNTDVTPHEAGFMRYIDLQRQFVGVEALRARASATPSITLTPFTIAGRQSARHGNKVIINDKEAGWVTSGSFGPSLGHCCGFAYVDPAIMGDANSFGIDNGRKIIDALVAETPFYSK